MAWGNFLSLPCPYRHWDGKLKNMMLGFLPLIGFAAGLLWFGLGVFVTFVGVPVILSSFAMTLDRKSTHLNSSHWLTYRMPSSA